MTTVELPLATRSSSHVPHRLWGAWLALLVTGLAVGGFAFAYQVTNGLGVTGLSNTVSWGMYIVSFMFLVGASAGGLIVVAGSELVGSHRFETISRLAVVCSFAAVATAAGTILPDLGRPQLAWKMITRPHLTSPLVWDMVVISVYLAIAAVDLYVLSRPQVSQRTMKRLAIITLPVAVLVHSVTAWIFGLLVARPFWHTPLLAPMFITSALVSGTALVVVITRVVVRTTALRLPDDVLAHLGKLLLWFIAADAFLLFAEVGTTLLSGEPDHREQLAVLLTGKLAWVFWPEVILGVAVPFVLLSFERLRRRTGMLVTASVLLLGGVLGKRINILFSAQFEPLNGMAPGIPGGRPGQGFVPDPIYVPTWVEMGVLVGMTAFFCTLVTIGVHRFVLPHRNS
jgi:dimethyl sulfoxide reductase membrane subunit